MKTRTSHQVLNEIAQDQIRQDIDLSPGILSKVKKADRNIMKSKVILTVIFTIAILLIVMVATPGAAQAMQRLFGYIPGSGLVEESLPLRILKEPVQSSRGDTRITVKDGVADAEQTILQYQVENIPAALPSQAGSEQELCHKIPWLQLADGSLLQGRVDSGNSWVSGYSRRVIFPALPASTASVMLVLPCFEQTSIFPGEQNWEIQLEFVDAPPQLTVYPLVDFPTSTVAYTPTTVPGAPEEMPVTPSQPAAPAASDISLSLSKYIQTGENIILFGSLEPLSSDFAIAVVDGSAVHLVDAGGNEIPLVEDPSLADPEESGTPGQSLAFTYRSAGRYIPGEASLTVDAAWIRLDESITFTFNPGSDLQAGKVWELNKSLEVSGRTVLIKSARMNETLDGFSFDLEIPVDVAEVTLMDLAHPLLGGGGGPGSYGFSYRDGIPTGEITVTLTSQTVEVTGPWQTTVDLPAFADGTTPTQTPEICLTHSSWQAALAYQTSVLPAGLTGKLVLSTLLDGDFTYHVMTANLDGSQQNVIALGDGASLSPDARQVIYASDSGLQRIELSTGVVTPLPDTGKNDRGVLWSLDGTRIAFTRGPSSGLIGAPGPYSLMIANPDGSSQQALLANADANTAQAWLPDGSALLYTVAGPDGASVRTINLQTGVVDSLFEVNYPYTTVAISPDGRRVAYEAMLPGDQYAVFVADLDGSNARLVVNTMPIVTTIPLWSPDGQWLILSVHDESLAGGSQMPVLTLVQVDTCQVVPLPSLHGYVSTWNR